MMQDPTERESKLEPTTQQATTGMGLMAVLRNLKTVELSQPHSASAATVDVLAQQPANYHDTTVKMKIVL